jgi:hypothetical protein
MTSAIQGPPNQYEFGYDFDYSLWVPGTTLDLYNVAWGNDYRDVVKFTSSKALDDYLNTLTSASLNIQQLSYVKPGQPIRVNIPHNRVIKYNYLRASNPLQPIDGDIAKNYYYYILDANYIAPNTTEVIVQLDVWQTYIYDMTIGNCFVERGHISIANTNAFNNWGRDYLTNPEGFDLGTDLRIIGSNVYPLTQASGDDYNTGIYSIIVVTTVDLESDPGDATNPHLYTAYGGVFAGMASGAAVYAFPTQAAYSNWLNTMRDKPWVTQGIVSSTVVPPIDRYWPDIVWEPNGRPTAIPGRSPQAIEYTFAENWRDFVISQIPQRYQSLKKFLTFPYCIVELTTLTANPIVLKPELWENDNAIIRERTSILPPNAQISFYPEAYNGFGQDSVNAEGMEMATHILNLPSMSIVNNMAIGYLASNRNSINYQYTSADWSQQKALTQNNLSVAQGRSTANLNRYKAGANQVLDMNQVDNANRTMSSQALVNGAADIVSGGINGSMGGLNPFGAAAGTLNGGVKAMANAINTNIQEGSNNQALANRLVTSRDITQRDYQQSNYIVDTNKKFADFAANGDYANAIANVVAKTRDAQMIQPAISGQQGGEIFNFVNNQFGLYLHYKLIDNAALRRVGEYWLRYGYAVDAFINIPQSFMVMTKFTYWKLQETYLVHSAAPEGFKKVIRGIFEKGVTVWSSPNDIGNIDWADNEPISGISY